MARHRTRGAEMPIAFSSPSHFLSFLSSLQQNLAQMSKMLPPHMLKMMGGPGALQTLMKQMEGKF